MGRRRPIDPPRDAESGLTASSPWCRRQREPRRTATPRPTRSPSGSGPWRASLARSFDSPEHTDHTSRDLYVGAADRLEVFVLRLEADVVALAEVALDRCLGLGFVVLADDRHDDVAVIGGVLLA